jgi:hypothetical protein
MDPDPDPYPAPDPTPFFIEFQDAKKKSDFFLITCPQVHHLKSNKLNFLLKFSVKIKVILQALFQSAQHIYEKREGSGARSAPLTNGSGSGRPKNMRILRVRIRFRIRIPSTARKGILRKGI